MKSVRHIDKEMDGLLPSSLCGFGTSPELANAIRAALDHTSEAIKSEGGTVVAALGDTLLLGQQVHTAREGDLDAGVSSVHVAGTYETPAAL